MKRFLFFFVVICFQLSLVSQSIVSVVPNEGDRGENLVVTVTGENTNWTQASSLLIFHQASNTIYPNTQSVISDTEVVGTFAFHFSHSPGYYDVSVSDLTLEDGFHSR